MIKPAEILSTVPFQLNPTSRLSRVINTKIYIPSAFGSREKFWDMSRRCSASMESYFFHSSKTALNNQTKHYRFCSALQRFNWSQSECGTLSQYVGHETGDRRAVQSHTKLSARSLDNFMEIKLIVSPAVGGSEQRTTFIWKQAQHPQTHQRCKYFLYSWFLNDDWTSSSNWC